MRPAIEKTVLSGSPPASDSNPAAGNTAASVPASDQLTPPTQPVGLAPVPPRVPSASFSLPLHPSVSSSASVSSSPSLLASLLTASLLRPTGQSMGQQVARLPQPLSLLGAPPSLGLPFDRQLMASPVVPTLNQSLLHAQTGASSLGSASLGSAAFNPSANAQAPAPARKPRARTGPLKVTDLPGHEHVQKGISLISCVMMNNPDQAESIYIHAQRRLLSATDPLVQKSLALPGTFKFLPGGGANIYVAGLPGQVYVERPRKVLGISCHQCKSTKPDIQLAHCSRLFTPKSTGEKRRCRKKYCENCLQKFYAVKLEDIKDTPWICASCQKVCCCAACFRGKVKGGGRSKVPGAASKSKASTGEPKAKRLKTSQPQQLGGKVKEPRLKTSQPQQLGGKVKEPNNQDAPGLPLEPGGVRVNSEKVFYPLPLSGQAPPPFESPAARTQLASLAQLATLASPAATRATQPTNLGGAPAALPGLPTKGP